ncbi:MAG: GTP-binding protein [Methanimicrococcus sp.]|nr:GTP-binding protein [Methanimicrococcus sp.]
MKVFIIGGFLGSGKTTTVLKLIQKLAANNKKVALIVNEIGEIGIDGETLEIAGIPSREITDGCICCSLKLGLVITVSELADIYKPDILIMEPTGLSFPSQIRDELLSLNIMMTFAPIVTLVDVSRFAAELSQIPKFVEQQFKEAEIIGINKIDLADDEKIQIVETFLKEMNPNAKILHMAASKNDDAVNQIYDLVMKEGKTIQELIDESFENESGSKEETLDSVEISNVSTYSGVYHIFGNLSENLSVKNAGALFEKMVTAAGKDIAKINMSFVGHIKMAVKIDDMLIKVSQTSGSDDTKIEAEYILQEKIENDGKYELRFLAAVTNVPKKDLEEIIDRSVGLILSEEGLTFEKQKQGNEKKLISL